MKKTEQKLGIESIAKRLQLILPNMSTRKIGEVCSVDAGVIQGIKQKNRVPTAEKIALICDAFHISLDWMLYERGQRERLSAADGMLEAAQAVSRNVAALPVFADVECGNFSWAESFEDNPEWVQVPEDICRPGRYILRAHGDSMAPEIREGDLCIFETPEGKVKDGDIIIAQLDGDNVGSTIKRYRHEPGVVRLMPENTEFRPIVLIEHPEGGYIFSGMRHVQLLIKGRLVAMMRKY